MDCCSTDTCHCGRCLAISTPNGVGNWFHKTWVDAKDGLNKFNTVKFIGLVILNETRIGEENKIEY